VPYSVRADRGAHKQGIPSKQKIRAGEHVSAVQQHGSTLRPTFFRPRRWLVREENIAVVPCAVGLEAHGRVGPTLSLELHVRVDPAGASFRVDRPRSGRRTSMTDFCSARA
jgi:hypothetical protein